MASNYWWNVNENVKVKLNRAVCYVIDYNAFSIFIDGKVGLDGDENIKNKNNTIDASILYHYLCKPPLSFQINRTILNCSLNVNENFKTLIIHGGMPIRLGFFFLSLMIIMTIKTQKTTKITSMYRYYAIFVTKNHLLFQIESKLLTKCK